jgi:NAD(P)-dependent dehydrogenase (short-subunit alcohol dehydrogenase family)
VKERKLAKRLDDRVAVVTGAARGFGLETARLFAREGASVALWDVNGDGVAEAASALEGDGLKAIGVQVDVGDSASVDAAAAATRERLGPVTVLVNNAGVVHIAQPWEVTDEDWEWHMRINAAGPFYCIRACLPDMKEQQYGKIINIGSIAAIQGRATTNPAYAASKGAVLALTATLSRSLGGFGVSVNAINPGLIKTEIHDTFTDEQLEVLTADIPLRSARRDNERGGRPSDIANAALFFASSDSDYVNGDYMNVNGGARVG